MKLIKEGEPRDTRKVTVDCRCGAVFESEMHEWVWIERKIGCGGYMGQFIACPWCYCKVDMRSDRSDIIVTIAPEE